MNKQSFSVMSYERAAIVCSSRSLVTLVVCFWTTYSLRAISYPAPVMSSAALRMLQEPRLLPPKLQSISELDFPRTSLVASNKIA